MYVWPEGLWHWPEPCRTVARSGSGHVYHTTTVIPSWGRSGACGGSGGTVTVVVVAVV